MANTVNAAPTFLSEEAIGQEIASSCGVGVAPQALCETSHFGERDRAIGTQSQPRLRPQHRDVLDEQVAVGVRGLDRHAASTPDVGALAEVADQRGACTDAVGQHHMVFHSVWPNMPTLVAAPPYAPLNGPPP